MAFCITCGTHTFTKALQDYEQVTARCQNCGNFSAKVCSRWEWFTLCFLPIIPFSLRPWHEVVCHICNFSQDLKYRQDIIAGQGNPIPMQNQGGGHPPGGAPGAPQQYKPPQYA